MKKIHLLTILCLLFGVGNALAQTTDFSSGVYILNEDWFGHRNSTLMHLSELGQFSYDLVGNNPDNAGKSLGCTSQYATFYNGRLYVISKQDQDSGESSSVRGGRIVVIDPTDHRILFSQDTIFTINGNFYKLFTSYILKCISKRIIQRRLYCSIFYIIIKFFDIKNKLAIHTIFLLIGKIWRVCIFNIFTTWRALYGHLVC